MSQQAGSYNRQAAKMYMQESVADLKLLGKQDQSSFFTCHAFLIVNGIVGTFADGLAMLEVRGSSSFPVIFQ